MSSDVACIVEAILTAILQWKVAWLKEQKTLTKPPPICRSQPKLLKITYENYKDYESTMVPLLMHEIWSQIYEEWLKIEAELAGIRPMEVDGAPPRDPPTSSSSRHGRHAPAGTCSRQFHIGVVDHRTEGNFQCLLKGQFIIETDKMQNHLKLIGEGDLVALDLAVADTPRSPNDETGSTGSNNSNGSNQHTLRLFGYVTDVNAERISQYTNLAECFTNRPRFRNFHVINYNIVIAKRKLKLRSQDCMRITGLYYLKPMIRQVESVASLRESTLAKDILDPKAVTCQLSVPTIVPLRSSHYNDMQYKAIIGANEALVRNIPKIQLIQGPPGTGKTHTLVGIIKHFYSNCPDWTHIPKILICAPSNGAIDEVARRLYRERDFFKRTKAQRSLRLVRVGHPDQISPSIKLISLEELVETNARAKVEGVRKKHLLRTKELETELSKCDTDITNMRYSQRYSEIPKLEEKMAKLLKDLEDSKAAEELNTRREISDASKKNMRYELIKNADVILSTLNSCQRHPLDVMFKGDRPELSFHCVIVDEASQCCEPELLMPLCYKISKMILIGDPMQLPATVISKYAQEFNFGRSMFERFFIRFGYYDPTSPITMLREQYRMHPEICKFPSRQFYDDRLITSRKPELSYPIRPYVIFDLRHGYECRSEKSLENEVEAGFVRNLLTAVVAEAPSGTTIGVITPYKGQKRLITSKIYNIQTERSIKIDVNTCDGFQGQEKDIIILSCVRAGKDGYVGFLKSVQRVNVALTRAKHSLMICLSARSLSGDETWSALINDAEERGFMQRVTRTPSSNDLKVMIAPGNPNIIKPRNGPSKSPLVIDLEDDYVEAPMDMDID